MSLKTIRDEGNMDTDMDTDRIRTIAEKLNELSGKLSGINAVVGFDGFVDIIARPIASGNGRRPGRYFESISEFSRFLTDRAGMSCSVELSQTDRKLGGNSPIFANALGRLGVSTTCIGAFGYPETEKVFRNIFPNCRIIPVAMPGTCTALEFGDGKVMLAMNGEINDMTWEIIARRAGMDNLIREFQNAKLIGLFNWSETPMASDIWDGILNKILPWIDGDKQIIFDFSDCARHETAEIRHMLGLVAEFGRRLPTIVSMNENEFSDVRDASGISRDLSVPECGEIIRRNLSARHIALHFREYSMGFSEEGIDRFDTLIINDPVISTGAGDNFNAGLCLGILSGFSPGDAMITASMTSSFYVAKGKSPGISELTEYMLENGKLIRGGNKIGKGSQ